MGRVLILLGPQRLEPNLNQAFERRQIGGRVATITAGWQEREGENDELREHLGREVVDLELHRRLEAAFADDRELFERHRERQDQLQAIQRLHRYRLDFVIEPARELLRRDDPSDILEAERTAAIAAIERLDREHLERIEQVHRRFRQRVHPNERPAIAEHRRELRQLLEPCSAVAIAGGHVAVLLNRMRLFGVAELFGDLPLFAWSAGAMALSERIVLFHDSPPQGAGNAEMLDLGLAIAPGIVPLPHARKRLRLDDPYRVALFARRFEPAVCALLEPGTTLELQASGWRPLTDSPENPARRLDAGGEVVDLTVDAGDDR